MDLVVPFEMEHGSQILKKDDLSIFPSVSLAVVPCGSSFLIRPMCLSGVGSSIFPTATLVAFGVQTLMQVTLLWPDPWPMSPPPTKGASGGNVDKKTRMEQKNLVCEVSLVLWGSRQKTT